MGQACCSGKSAVAQPPVKKGSSVHIQSSLVRKQQIEFDEIYEIVGLIGEGSISNIYKIRRKERAMGGSSNQEFLAHKLRLKLGTVRRSEACTRPSSCNQQQSARPVEYYALKEIDLSIVKQEIIDLLTNEIKLLKKLDHPNVIKAYETFHRNKRLAIVMELCFGGDLYSREPYTEAQAARIVRQILSALEYLHKRKVIHRDIKYENILFENQQPRANVKLIDFGLATVYLNQKLTDRVGTLYTMSPQVIRGEYTSQADLWSVGVVTYMLMSGKMPFWAKTRIDMILQISQCRYTFANKLWKDRSEEGKDFISKLLLTDPKRRLTAKKALRHPWLSENTSWSERTLDTEALSNVQANLVQYAGSSEVKRIALNAIAKKSTTEDIFQLRKVFCEIDTAGDGTITFQEFQAALSKFNYSHKEIEEIFQKVDINRNNVIMYTEFLAATLEAQGRIEERRIAEAFDLLDDDDTGYISKDNLRKITGGHLSDSDLVDELDADGDGQISYEEFKQVFEDEVANNVARMCDGQEQTLDKEALA